MNFAEPRLLWLVLAAPLAALGRLLASPRDAPRAEAAWASRGLEPRLRAGSRPRARSGRRSSWASRPCGIALALARPRWGESIEKVEREGVDIVFVLDTSASMAADDVCRPASGWPSRWCAAWRSSCPAIASHWCRPRASAWSWRRSPSTSPCSTCCSMPSSPARCRFPAPGSRPRSSKALDLFPAGHDKHRVLVLLSDGEDHDEDLAPVDRRS